MFVKEKGAEPYIMEQVKLFVEFLNGYEKTVTPLFLSFF